MPTRSSPNSATTDYFHKDTQVNGVSSESSHVKNQLNWIDSVTFGENLKDWRELLRDGLSATTSMSGTKVVTRYTPGYGRFEVSKQGLIATNIYLVEEVGSHKIAPAVPSGNPASISETKSNAEAMGRFLRRIREKQAAFQGGVFLGELAQTLALIRNPAKGLRGLADETWSALSSIRRLGFKNSLSRIRVTEQLADAWLELQFGWKPLIHDIDDACKALAILNTGQSLHTGRITASYQTEEFSAGSTTGFGNRNVSEWYTTGETVSRCMVIYRGAMRTEARNAAEMRRDLLGFNSDNFAPTIYNLIPWTFLIDYFTNIGDIIEGWSLLDTRLAWCNKTTRKEIELTRRSGSDTEWWHAHESASTPLVSLSFSPAKFVATKSVVTRTKYEQAIVPDFVFRIPSFGSLKWLNIAALVAGRNNDRKWFYGD